jgi:hypothetical protein
MMPSLLRLSVPMKVSAAIPSPNATTTNKPSFQ